MIATINSKNGIPIRLTDERWAHITEEHTELTDKYSAVLETVAKPTRILAGGEGELLATREIEAGKWLIVAYRELANDGFVITAFMTSKVSGFERRKQLWP